MTRFHVLQAEDGTAILAEDLSAEDLAALEQGGYRAVHMFDAASTGSGQQVFERWCRERQPDARVETTTHDDLVRKAVDHIRYDRTYGVHNPKTGRPS